MKEALFFVKFGQKEHLQQLVDGKIYFSNAKAFMKLEEEQQKKGQGDAFEGRFFFPFLRAEFRHKVTKEIIQIVDNSKINLGFEGIETMPLFCITAGNLNDCEYIISEKNYKIKFNPKKEAVIRTHFREANSVLIIKTPDIFISDVKNIFNNNCYADFVRYFNMSVLTDDRLAFLMGVPELSKLNTENMSFFMTSDNVYKHLYCKDIYFNEQQEFRFIPSSIMINEPRIFDLQMNSSTELCDLDSFFAGVEIKI
jgi:hypothetical protein